MNKINLVIDKLVKNNGSVSLIGSYFGGCVVGEFVKMVEFSSIVKCGTMCYSLESIINIGVDKEILDKYSVNHINVVKNMSKSISCFGNSSYGIAIGGVENDTIYVSIYSFINDKYLTLSIDRENNSQEEFINKVINSIVDMLLFII